MCHSKKFFTENPSIKWLELTKKYTCQLSIEPKIFVSDMSSFFTGDVLDVSEKTSRTGNIPFQDVALLKSVPHFKNVVTNIICATLSQYK